MGAPGALTPVAHRLRHPAGHQWLVICMPTDDSKEWIIDGAADRDAAEAKLKQWAGRGSVEWHGEFQFRIAEATR